VEEDGECIGVEIRSCKTIVWIHKESEWCLGTDVTFSRLASVYLNGCLHIMGTHMGTIRYLLWIWRERHRGKFIGLVVLYSPSIKLRVTCVYVLLVVAICPSF
jgi:hypothetical protein